MKWPQKELLSFFTDAKPWEGMNKEMSLKELINGYPFQSDSKATPACVTIMDLLTFLQRYSNRYQNILMQCNTGWNIIATSQQTKTSWDNCIAKENWLSPWCHLRLWGLSSESVLFGAKRVRWDAQNQLTS